MGRIKVIEPVTVIVYARDSWWDVKTPTAKFTEDGRITPYGGVIWDFAQDWSLYGSYSTVYQPQTGRTLSGKMLKPVEGQTLEGGVKAGLLNGSLNLSGVIYQIDIKNNPQIDPEHPSGGFNNYFVSGGKVRSQGFELEGVGFITLFWDVSVGYTYTDTKYLDDSLCRIISDIVPLSLYATVTDKRSLNFVLTLYLKTDFSYILKSVLVSG